MCTRPALKSSENLHGRTSLLGPLHNHLHHQVNPPGSQKKYLLEMQRGRMSMTLTATSRSGVREVEVACQEIEPNTMAEIGTHHLRHTRYVSKYPFFLNTIQDHTHPRPTSEPVLVMKRAKPLFQDGAFRARGRGLCDQGRAAQESREARRRHGRRLVPVVSDLRRRRVPGKALAARGGSRTAPGQATQRVQSQAQPFSAPTWYFLYKSNSWEMSSGSEALTSRSSSRSSADKVGAAAASGALMLGAGHSAIAGGCRSGGGGCPAVAVVGSWSVAESCAHRKLRGRITRLSLRFTHTHFHRPIHAR